MSLFRNDRTYELRMAVCCLPLTPTNLYNHPSNPCGTGNCDTLAIAITGTVKSRAAKSPKSHHTSSNNGRASNGNTLAKANTVA